MYVPSEDPSWDPPCHVYFIGPVDVDRCKIGVANDPRKRLKDLETSSGWPLKIYACVQYPSREAAFEAERKVHNDLTHRHIKGEWFRLTPDEIDGLAVALESNGSCALVARAGLDRNGRSLALPASRAQWRALYSLGRHPVTWQSEHPASLRRLAVAGLAEQAVRGKKWRITVDGALVLLRHVDELIPLVPHVFLRQGSFLHRGDRGPDRLCSCGATITELDACAMPEGRSHYSTDDLRVPFWPMCVSCAVAADWKIARHLAIFHERQVLAAFLSHNGHQCD